MPQIIVTAGATPEQDDGNVMLRERINPADFESDRFAANLVERLGWAVVDASEAEERKPSPGDRRQADDSDEHDSGPETGGATNRTAATVV